MRNPGIHIGRSQLIHILDELGISDFPIDEFIKLSKRYTLNTRGVMLKYSERRKVQKLELSNFGDAALFADILYAERIKLKHRGVKKINESSGRDWDDICKNLANICNNFCKDFNLETRAGFIKYIEIGISRMGGNNRNLLQRLISMSENIFIQYGDEEELKEDSNPWLTNQGFEYYIQKIAKVTGIYDNKKDPSKLIIFKRLGEKLQDPKRIQQWIDAQFYALAFVNGVPSINDLLSDKALERYNKYLYKIKHKEELPPEESLDLWNQINDNNNDDLPF